MSHMHICLCHDHLGGAERRVKMRTEEVETIPKHMHTGSVASHGSVPC